jgi:DNA-directed RNA polymerase specialized sigma24 family protein
MAGTDDDIIALGGRRRPAGRDEAIEELFRADYPRLARRALALVGDRDLAEQVGAQAYLSLWRHWDRVSDPRQARAYLDRRVAALASKIVKPGAQRREGTQSAAHETHQEATDGAAEVDTARAWREFEALRVRRTAARHRHQTAGIAIATLAAVAIAYLVLERQPPEGRSHRRSAVSSVITYPGAVVARFDLSGVTSVVGNLVQAWAVRTVGQPGADPTYQLVGMDLQKNDVLYRKNLGRKPRAIAAGASRVWLTTPYGQAGGQIVRIDPATGRVVRTLHLPAGRCTDLLFGSGYLFAACGPGGPLKTELWKINPMSGRAFRLASGRGCMGSLVAAPGAVWCLIDFSRLGGLVQATASQWQPVTVQLPSSDSTPTRWWGLASDSGSLWVLGDAERLAKIDTDTAYVQALYTSRNYDPAGTGGLDFFTAGGGWLWFLGDGYPFSGVLKVSEATGRPVGSVPIAPNSCGQQTCSQIFYTPGSVWVPTAEQLIRIDPALTYYHS